MYLIPKSEIEIGSIRLYGENSGINSVEINTSVKDLSQSGKVVVPLNFKQRDGKKITDLIKIGNSVVIRLGYGENVEEEFRGYVSKVGASAPLTIEVEDEWYKWKKAEQMNKSWKTTTLREVLNFVFSGWTVECVDVSLNGGFVIHNATPYEVVKGLKESYGFSTRIDEKEKTVRCFYAYDFKGFREHTYVFGTRKEEGLEKLKKRGLSPNVVKNNLKYEKRDDRKLFVTGKSKDKAGKEIRYEIGSKDKGAERRTLNFGSEVSTLEELKEITTARYRKWNYDGYTGKITGFGYPQVKAGDSLSLIDVDNEEREGKYLVESVKVSYSVSGGFRRECSLSYKV